MEYTGKLYGKIGNKYFDTGFTSEDYDKLKKENSELQKQVLNLPVVTTRTFECQRCYTIYEDVEGEPPTTCITPNEFRTSGICGGELREVIA